jgi:AcrR family transcriptional regulator
MGHQAFLRARRPEHKRQRREAILAAARELALTSGVRTVSLAGVASAVGLAKSNVSRYFGTREEIYLELTAEGWREWGRAVAERLDGASGPDAVVDALAEPFLAMPLFCDLLGQVSTILEYNVSVDAARHFKHTMYDVVADVVPLVVAAQPTLNETEAAEVVQAASGVAGLLYPLINPPPTLVQLYEQDERLAESCPEFLPSAKRLIAAVIAGLPTLR